MDEYHFVSTNWTCWWTIYNLHRSDINKKKHALSPGTGREGTKMLVEKWTQVNKWEGGKKKGVNVRSFN